MSPGAYPHAPRKSPAITIGNPFNDAGTARATRRGRWWILTALALLFRNAEKAQDEFETRSEINRRAPDAVARREIERMAVQVQTP